MIIAAAVVGLVFGSVALVASSSSSTFQQSALQGALEDETRRTLQRIVDAVQMSGSGSIAGVPQFPLWSDSMNFDTVRDVAATDGSITWSPSRLQLEYVSGETDNGIDDNRNGIDDEGCVVLIVARGLPDERRVVLSRWVREYAASELPDGADENGNGLADERGLCFTRSGSTLGIRLTLERRDSKGRVSTCTTETTVQLRN